MKYIKIADVFFSIKMDEIWYNYFKLRFGTIYCQATTKNICKINMKRVANCKITNDYFLEHQEPIYKDNKIYREIFSLGSFEYNRQSGDLNINYVLSENYKYDPYEVIVDTICQFIYLIMIDYKKLPLHCAILKKENNAVLIFGNSMAGKSTLEITLHNLGLEYYSDDIAFFDEDGYIWNSGEDFVCFTKNTYSIIKTLFPDEKEIDNISSVFSNKSAFKMQSQYTKKIKPMVIILPNLDKRNLNYNLVKLTEKDVFISLITMLISKQFGSSEKKNYFNALLHLSKHCLAYRFDMPLNLNMEEYLSFSKAIVDLL